MPRPFAVIGFTVFFTIALLFDSDIGVTAGVLTAYAVALIVSLIIRETRKHRVLPCAFTSGIIACILLITEISFYYLPSVDYGGKTCHTVAQLTDYPELKYGNYYYDAKTVEIDGEAVEHKIRLVFSSLPDAEPYDMVEGDFTFYILGSSSEEYLASNKAKGIFLGAYPKGGKYSVTIVPEADKPFMKTVVDARKLIKNTINKAVPGDSGALIIALVLGDKSSLPSEIISDFRLSGITHIICVSGLHLSLLTMVILEVLRFFKVNPRLANVIASIGVVGFMIIAGMTYSVVRAGVMMLLYLLANIIWKKRDSLNSLGFALTLIAVFNPFAMGSIGLQLSSLATLGLIIYSQKVKPEIDEFIDKYNNEWLARMVKKLTDAVCIPVAATALTIPVSIGIYDEFNFAVFATNLIAVPVAGLCMIVGIFAAIVCYTMTDIFNVFAFAAEFSAQILLRISSFFAEFDWLTFRADDDTHKILICGIFLMCAAAIFVAYAGKNAYKITCALCAVVFVSGLVFSSVSRDFETRINVVDVGNGTAVLVSKNGENILVGCGGTEFLGASKISEEILKYGGETDVFIVPDADDYSASYLNDLLLINRPRDVYCGDLPAGSDLLLGRCNVYDYSSIVSVDNFEFKAYDSSCLYMKNGDVSALICFNPISDFSALPEEVKSCDIIISRNDYPCNLETENCKLLVVNSENERGIIIQNELSQSGVNCVATGGCGNILIRAENRFISATRTD